MQLSETCMHHAFVRLPIKPWLDTLALLWWSGTAIAIYDVAIVFVRDRSVVISLRQRPFNEGQTSDKRDDNVT